MKESNSAIYVARGASYLFIQNMASTIILITAFALIARLISQAKMGILVTLTLLVGICQLTANLGLPNAATKFIAEHLGKRLEFMTNRIGSFLLGREHYYRLFSVKNQKFNDQLKRNESSGYATILPNSRQKEEKTGKYLFKMHVLENGL